MDSGGEQLSKELKRQFAQSNVPDVPFVHEVLLSPLFDGKLVLRGNHPALVKNRLDDRHAECLAQALRACAKALTEDAAASATVRVTELDVAYNRIGDSGAAALAAWVQEAPGLVRLSLQANDLGGPGAAALSRALQLNESVRELNLAGNQIELEGGMAVASMLQVNTTLTTLTLRSCRLAPDAVIALASVLRNNPSVAALDLGDNMTSGFHQSHELHANVLQHVADLARCSPALHTLSLAKMAVTDWAMGDFCAHGLASSATLTVLDLSCNKISRDGAVALCAQLQQHPASPLQELTLSSNAIQNEGAAAVAALLGTSSCRLRVLRLDNNSIGPAGLVSLATALARNSSVTSLSLAGNDWDAEAAAAFAPLVGGVTKCISVGPPRTSAPTAVAPVNDAAARDPTSVDGMLERAATLLTTIDKRGPRLDPTCFDMQFAITEGVYTAHLNRQPTAKAASVAYAEQQRLAG